MAKLLSTLTNLLCATGTFTTIATLAVLLTTVNVCEASSNTVSITHRSYTTTNHNDDNNVHVIKSEPQRNEEYVTSFYKRVREKHRANFGRQLEESTQRMIEEEESAIRSRNPNHDGDHSLDHYFDHQLNSNHHGSSYNNSKKEKEEERKKPALRAAELTSVRGGGAIERRRRRLVQSPAFVTTDKKGDIWSPRDGSRSYEKRGRRGSRRNSRDFEEDEFDLDEEGYNEDVQEDMFDEGEEQQQHHLGLLRVPCSIAVNSGEATHHASSHAKTSMATYVDTGAQVTIISASAAKRAGIYHLMDRRYAGRATGVGQCRILGRIPARHVYFLLGEGRCDGDEEQGFDDEDWLEEGYPRGGDQDDVFTTNGRGVQMDGPALTVLEGTVTQGVDILLGLDVLQDWDAEIRMGKKKSITVHKRGRNGGSSGVVIPFASSRITAASNRRYPRREEGDRRHPSSDTSTRHHHHSHSRSTHHRHNKSKAIQDDILSSNFDNDDVQDVEIYEEDTDDEDFSPTASDIESDLDWLDQSGHEFPSEEASYHDGGNSLQDLEDEMLRCKVGSVDDDDEDTDYDSDEDIEEDLFDMAGY